jgi:MFS family permease
LWVVFVKEVLGGGEPEYGWVQVAVATGALAGGPILACVSQRLSPGRLIGISSVWVGLLLLATFYLPLLPPILALQFLVGIPAVGFSVTHRTLLQARTEDRYLGRVLGALDTTHALLMLGGQALASALGDRVGVVPLLNLAGFLYLPGAIVALVMLSGARFAQRTSSGDG